LTKIFTIRYSTSGVLRLFAPFGGMFAEDDVTFDKVDVVLEVSISKSELIDGIFDEADWMFEMIHRIFGGTGWTFDNIHWQLEMIDWIFEGVDWTFDNVHW